MTINSIVRSFLVYTFLGLNMEAGAIYTLCTALGEFLYHTNVKTPQWVGYIFQRPEMHHIHHEYEKHTNKTEILFGGICCLEAMKTQKNLIVLVALIQKKN
jgi:sterol desaturase/sphingolipid hydroxylase (fatty acid hydroxylase superfamily)